MSLPYIYTSQTSNRTLYVLVYNGVSRVFIFRFCSSETTTFRNSNLVRVWYSIRYNYFLTFMFNGASTSGLKFVLIDCSWLHCFMAFCKVFIKLYDKVIPRKILNYSFLKIQAHQTRKNDAAVCFCLNLLWKWT